MLKDENPSRRKLVTDLNLLTSGANLSEALSFSDVLRHLPWHQKLAFPDLSPFISIKMGRVRMWFKITFVILECGLPSIFDHVSGRIKH